ncbi:hypothetical protein [Streptomyces sp. TRM 70351]|uniref:hypothetical protein n=1 Tax=Streptomyces sp. TRM 70351 TaxID=3116552 RepID=UPI003FCC93AD
MARNGTACHTTSSTRTVKAAGPCASQEWSWKESNPRRTSSQSTTPSREANSHWKTVVVAMTGLAQASTSPLSTRVRIPLPRRWSISATAVPIVMMRTTLIPVCPSVRRVTCQNSASSRISR